MRPALRFAIGLCGFLVAFLCLAAATSADTATPALVQAAEEGDLARVTQLLDVGTDPNAHDAWRNTGLIYAARDGRVEMVKLLIARGADVNWIDGEKRDPS